MFNLAISPHHVAGVTLVGGLATGGYFAYQAVVPPSLEAHLKSLNVQLLSDDWSQKVSKYKTELGADLIPNIPASNEVGNNGNLAKQLQEWCEKKKSKYYFGETNETYKRFSLWCTVGAKISAVLGGRNGIKVLDDVKKQTKVDAYNLDTNTDKFITKSVEKIEKIHLDEWCKTEQDKDYQYETEAIKKVISWCYDK